MKHIVITWWPHAGKSSFLPKIAKHIESHWYEVKLIPEMATLLYNEWIHPHFQNITTFEFQSKIVTRYLNQLALILSDPYLLSDKLVIISDRRIPDWSAYMSPSEYEHSLFEHKLTEEIVMSQIDWVLHLESTALIWLLDIQTNLARAWMSVHDAIELEHKTQEAYTDYAYKRIIISNLDWSGAPIDTETKLHHAKKAIMQLMV